MASKARRKAPAGWIILAGVHEFETAKQLATAAQARGVAISITSAEQLETYEASLSGAEGLVLCLHNPSCPQYLELFEAIGGRKNPSGGPVIVARWSSRYRSNLRLYFTQQGVNVLYAERDELDIESVLALMEAALPSAPVGNRPI